jgi:hypothetical protein
MIGDLYLVAVGASLALVVFLVFSIWSRRFGSQVVERWAKTRGFRVISVRRRSFVPHWRLLSSKGFQFFRLTVRDRDGANHKAWLRLESDCTDLEIIDVIWDDKNPSVAHWYDDRGG